MLKIKNLYKKYGKNKIALDNINLEIKKGDTVAIIGESGSGKSSLGRIILGLDSATKGEIFIEEKLSSFWHKKNKGKASVVFQNYRSSINPSFTIKESLQEIFWNKKEKKSTQELKNLLKSVNIRVELLDRFPHQLSGGELQRTAFLRALLTKPELLVLDEALNGLDISNQLEIIKIFNDYKKNMTMTTIFISHDLEVATMLCDKLIVLKEGKVIENLEINELNNAQHQYTQSLLNSVVQINFN